MKDEMQAGNAANKNKNKKLEIQTSTQYIYIYMHIIKRKTNIIPNEYYYILIRN